MDMKTAIVYISIVATAIGLGVAGGIAAKKIMGGEETVYIGDANSLEMDMTTLKAKYESYRGSTPEKDFTPTELINICFENYRNCENSYSFTIGVADTIVSQTVRNYQIRNGNEYFEESISRSSMVKLANRMTQSGKDGNITLYSGTATSDETASYGEKGTEYSQEEYTELLGRTLDAMFIYVISNRTVENAEVVKNSEGYELTFELNPDIATYKYKRQMKNISNLDNLPSFEKVKLTYQVDNNLLLTTCHVDETYKATMGVTVTINNNFNVYYHPNQIMKIPSLNESLDYSLKGEN